MTFAELIASPQRTLTNLLASVRRIFNFAEERTNRAVRFLKVLKAYRDGTPVNTIVSEYQCSRSTVLRYARIAAVPKRAKNKADQAAVIADYKNKIPIKEIARKHGIAPSRVSTIAKQANLCRYPRR